MPNIKGSVIVTSRDQLIETHGRPVYEQALAMLSDGDRKTIEVALVPDQWYSIDLFVRWLAIVVEVACDSDEHGLIERGARGAASELTGIYKAFALLASADSVMERLATFDKKYFDGVTATAKKVASGNHVITYTELTASHRLFEYIIVGWWKQILATTRAKNGKAEVLTSLATGRALEIALTWDA